MKNHSPENYTTKFINSKYCKDVISDENMPVVYTELLSVFKKYPLIQMNQNDRNRLKNFIILNLNNYLLRFEGAKNSKGNTLENLCFLYGDVEGNRKYSEQKNHIKEITHDSRSLGRRFWELYT